LICSGCDYILDSTFLGDDITDDERERRPGAKGESRRFGKKKADGVDFGEDAMILGDVNDVEVSSFQSRDAGVSQREVTQTRFYIGGGLAQLMEANAIPEMAAGVSGASIRMTPFERHVLGFVNGRRSVGRIQKKSAMDESEFKTALAMLADKGFIRLKGWKKPKTPSAGDSLTGSRVTRAPSQLGSQAVMRPAEPERTVVASMEHIEALARKNAPLDQARAASRRGPVPQIGSQADTPAMPHAEMATVVAQAPSPDELKALKDTLNDTSKPKLDKARKAKDQAAEVVPSRRFASLQASSPTSDSESARRRILGPDDDVADSDADVSDADAGADVTGKVNNVIGGADDDDDGVDPLAVAAANVWDDTSNQSSVFADSDGPLAPSPKARVAVAVADALDDSPDDVPDDLAYDVPNNAPDDAAAEADDDGGAAEADAFDDFGGATGGFEALRDPTGLGDSLMPDDNRGGAAIDDDDDDGDGDGDDDDRPYDDDDDDDVGFVSAEAIGEASRALQAPNEDNDDDDDELGPPRRIHDEVTAAPPRIVEPAELLADDDEDPDAAAPTRQLESPRPLTLPSEALSPVIVEPAAAPMAPALSVAPTAPSTAVPRPTSAPAVMPLPGQSVAAAQEAPPPMLALPGQALVKPGDAPLPAPSAPAPAKKPLAPTRVSAASQVPFELRKKAERIYEQALKDHSEGRLSSALMNAKLAMNFDSTVDAYREFFEALNKEKAQPKGPRPQELVLFEQASDAEGKGDYKRAVILLEQALAISPKAAALHNRLGVILSIRLKRHDEALAHLKLAIELEPGSIVYMNNFSKVTGLLESVLERDPKKNRKGAAQGEEKVAVKKIRPKPF